MAYLFNEIYYKLNIILKNNGSYSNIVSILTYYQK